MFTKATPLHELLAEGDPDLATRYLALRQRLAQGIQKYSTQIGPLPDHGEQHYRNVEENLDWLLPEEMKKQMPPEEIFVLLCATQFHGVGLLYESNEYTSDILLDYPERTWAYIQEHCEEWQLDKPEAHLIQSVCLGLSLDAFPEDLLEEGVLHHSTIHVRFLAALLRLADTLDVDYSSVSRYVLKMKRLSPGSLEQWIKRTQIAGVKIQPDKWRIGVSVFPETAEGRRILRDYVEGKLQAELDLVRPTLEKYGIYYSHIQMEIPTTPVQLDKRITQGLAKYPKYYPQYASPMPHAVRHPYKFLDYFDPVDEDLFFGRGSDIERFKGYIDQEQMVVLYGESGVGKTSLIRAGLLPRLIRSGHIPVYARCLDLPTEIIKEEISRIVTYLKQFARMRGLPSRLNAKQPLRAFFEQLRPLKYKIVVFLDQFEEFFIKFPPDIQSEFIDELIECLDTQPKLEVTFVLSLRRERFVDLGRFKSRLLELFGNAHELRKLTEEELREAIEQPALQCGTQYEEGLVKELVSDIFQGGNYNTPHIQIVCDKLERTTVTRDMHLITRKQYEDMGSTRKILAEYLEAEVAKFPPEEQGNIKAILKELVTSEGTKMPLTVETIARRARLDSVKAEHLLLELANRARLVRVLELDGEAAFELAHEFLVGQVSQWYGERDREVKSIYEMLNRQIIGWERFGFLLDLARLERVNRYKGVLSLDDRSKALILASCLRNDPAGEMKWFWLDTLSKDAALNLVVEVIREADDKTAHTESVKVLARLGADAPQLLISRLSDTDWKVRQALIEALVLCGQSGLDDLRAALGHSDRRVRRGVATALARLEDH